MKPKNQKKGLLFQSLGLGICAGILLVNRFIKDIPDWLAIVLLAFAIIFMFIGFYFLFKKKL